MQTYRVSKHIKFVGAAKHKQNVEGPFHPEMIHFHDHFTVDTLSTDNWLATVTNATIAVHHSTYPGGMCRIATDNTDNESSFLATPLMWEDDMNAICEAKILISDVSGLAVFFGFSDSRYETTPAMPIDYADGTLATVAGNNTVGFICDYDDSVNGPNSIVGVGANAGTLETAIDSGTDWADTTWHVLRVELNPDGDAVFYLDGTAFGVMTTAITSGTHLCIITAVANRDAAIDYVYLDRVDGWQDEI